MAFLGIKTGIITRNTRSAVELALKNFKTVGLENFNVLISRDDDVAPKPSGEGVLQAACQLQVDPGEILMIGDFVFDVQAGKEAGATTVFLDHGKIPIPGESDFVISDLDAVRDIVRLGTALPAGKFPNDLLRKTFLQNSINDPSMLIYPGIGEDVAAVDVDGEQVLVLKSDPITFAAEAIGYYAVIVNANDIATSGAIPRWMLTTLLFPEQTTPSMIISTIEELQKFTAKWNITLCGGHTEITDAVNRTVVTGMLCGTVKKDRLIDKRNMASGDIVLLTKKIAVEGTSIIAAEFKHRLIDLDMPAGDIERCREFINKISVIEEARIAADHTGTTAMHDVTEGGLATALSELSIAGNRRLTIRMDKIPVFAETKAVCRLLGLDPMGLIGSGSLLITCHETACADLEKKLIENGISVTRIGHVTEKGEGIDARNKNIPVAWPQFEVDEITKLF